MIIDSIPFIFHLFQMLIFHINQQADKNCLKNQSPGYFSGNPGLLVIID
jgi:hypothetical protein